MLKKYCIWFLVVCFLSSVVPGVWGEDSFVVVPAQKQFTSAESRIKVLAKKSEEARINSGLSNVGLGALYIGLGATYSQSSYYSGASSYSAIYYLLGGGLALLGIKDLVVPTELESDYHNLKAMPAASLAERGEREGVAEKVLVKGAEKAAEGRKNGALILGGAGLVGFTASPLYGAVFIGAAAMSYFTKSEIEKAAEEYQEEKKSFIGESRPTTTNEAPALTAPASQPDWFNELVTGEGK
ncbi:MAG: hypothetical protein WC405_18875 [Syntrophales bacterium]